MMELAVAILLLILLFLASWRVLSESRLLVDMTLVSDASNNGGFCLDGSLPAYHLHRGFGAGESNWLLQFEGGGWCNDIQSCLDRAKTKRGSSLYMNKLEDFNGILSNDASLNPDFYNWNRVKLRYCDGGSFSGDAKFDNGTSVLYFRGQKIWEAIILDLLPKGLGKADKDITDEYHCEMLERCWFFLDERDIALNYTMRTFFENLVSLQGIEKNLDKNCTSFLDNPKLCMFPQYFLNYMTTPFFILNTAYDVYQFHHALVPPSADMNGDWKGCKLSIASCTPQQLDILQGFRGDMLAALRSFLMDSTNGGMFINSCFGHCQSETQETWFSLGSPIIQDKTIAGAVGDWYFSRNISKLIDCAYPCDASCHNIIAQVS